jgi:hypothetical protein
MAADNGTAARREKMIGSPLTQMPRQSEARRREVESALSAYVRPPNKRFRRLAEVDRSTVRDAIEVRRVLEGLGPVFSAFGLYLSTRPDMLPLSDCRDLSLIRDQAPAISVTRVREIVISDLGRSVAEAFGELEPSAYESRLFYQSHRATLRNGDSVSVRVRRMGSLYALDSELDLLALLDGFFWQAGWSGLRPAIQDFRENLQRELEFSLLARNLESMAEDARAFEMLHAPPVYGALCSGAVLTLAHPPASPEPAREQSGAPANNAAFQLFAVWLRQALRGRAFPLEPRPGNFELLPAGKVAFTGGAIGTLPEAAKVTLWNYFVAASNDDPDNACSCLLSEMENGTGGGSEFDFRRRVRQIVPFRDGGGDGISGMAEHLLLYWKVAREEGFCPRPHLLDFYRGLAAIACGPENNQWDGDPLRAGFQTLRSMVIFEEIHSMMGLQPVSRNLERYLSTMVEFPARFDRVLSGNFKTADRSAWVRERTGDGPRMRASSSRFTALLLAFAALIFLARVLSRAGGPWRATVGGIACAAAGAILLWSVERTR